MKEEETSRSSRMGWSWGRVWEERKGSFSIREKEIKFLSLQISLWWAQTLIRGKKVLFFEV